MMEFLMNNWHLIIIAIAAVVVVDLAVWQFFRQSKSARHEQIRGWLLQAVILAEQEYGSGTGKMKLSAVYDAFCATLPWLARVISFETFALYVDEALDEAKEILGANKDMAALAETMVSVE